MPEISTGEQKITIGQMQEPELGRRAALITLSRINSYQDLKANNAEAGNELFKQETRRLWTELAVSGKVYVDKSRSGEILIKSETDLDGRCSLGILELSGINTKKVKYLAPGGYEEGNIHLDTGNKDGLQIEVSIDETGAWQALKTAYIDHHGPDSKNNTSATLLAYETMVSLGLLEKTENLDRLVDFVTQVDNRSFPKEKDYYKSSYRTVWGLERFMSFGKVCDYFAENRSPFAELTPIEIEKMGLIYQSKQEKQNIEVSTGGLKRIEQEGFVIESPTYGKIVIDITMPGGKKHVPGGFVAAKASGYGGYIIWSKSEDSFFVSTSLPLRLNLQQGRAIRETMWIKPRGDGQPLTIKLEDILIQLAGGNLKPQNKLRDYLRDEKRGVVTLR